jgi:CHAT domain-containing protein
MSLPRPSIRRTAVAASAASLAWLAAACHTPVPAAEPAERALAAGPPLRQSLAGGAHHRYSLRLAEGDSVQVALDQGATDFALTIDAGRRLTIDRQERGVETATLLADRTGRAVVSVAPRDPSAPEASYTIALRGPARRATASDRARARAEMLESDSKRVASERAAGALQRSLAPLQEALDAWRALGDPSGIAGALARRGDVLPQLGELDRAVEAYTEALPFEPGATFQRAAILNNLAVTRGRRGELLESRRTFEQAHALWRALGDRDAEAALAVNEGSLSFEAGDYQAALDRFLSALPALEPRYRVRTALALNNVGVTYRALGDLDAARSYLTRSSALFSDAEAVPRGRTLLRLGQIALDQGDVAAADTHAQAARATMAGAGDRVAEADALVLMGRVAATAGRHDEALARYGEALTLYERSSARRGLGDALQHAGRAYAARGDTATALDRLRRALAIRQSVGLPDAEAETRYELALVERQGGALEAADTQLASALDLIESVRGHVGGEYSRATYYAARQKYFTARIDVLMALHERQPRHGFARTAFEVSERERARALVDTLRESGNAVARNADPTLLDRQRHLRAQLNVWSLRLARFSDREATTREEMAARDTVNRLVLELRETDARIEAADPDYARLSEAPLRLAGVQTRLLGDDDTVLLRFVLGERRSYGFAVTRTSFTAVPLPSRVELDRLAADFVAAVREPRTPATSAALRARAQQAAAALGGALLNPLAGRLGSARWLIVCDGALQGVPFAALQEPGGVEPLVVRHEIVMLPSASALAAIRRYGARRTPPLRTLAVVADPVYEPDDPRISAARVRRTAASGPSVGRLPLSKFEGESILEHAPPADRAAAFGFAATREAVIERLRDSRIVHVAAHAIPDEIRPELSSLVLSLYRDDGQARDGLLRLHDLTGEIGRIRADVVVLSACETAIGKDVPGEGFLGLARGFLGAGAHTVISSVYRVEEEQTLELMRIFYGELLGRRGATPSGALRAAQLRLLAQPRFRDPHYWSAFVATGDYRG